MPAWSAARISDCSASSCWTSGCFAQKSSSLAAELPMEARRLMLDRVGQAPRVEGGIAGAEERERCGARVTDGRVDPGLRQELRHRQQLAGLISAVERGVERLHERELDARLGGMPAGQDECSIERGAHDAERRLQALVHRFAALRFDRRSRAGLDCLQRLSHRAQLGDVLCAVGAGIRLRDHDVQPVLGTRERRARALEPCGGQLDQDASLLVGRLDAMAFARSRAEQVVSVCLQDERTPGCKRSAPLRR